MNIQEQNYADYLFPLTPQEAAQSWDRVQTNVPMAVQEIDYHTYLVSLSQEDAEDSMYAIFSDLYDRVNVSIHEMYYTEFENLGYSMAVCKRRKEPAK